MGRFTTRDIILSLICFACFLAALVLIAPQVHADDALPATIPSTFDLDSLGVDSRLLPGVPALTQYQNEVAKAKTNYETAVLKAAEELRKKLAAAQEQATKSGDLDKALAIRAAMDKLPKAPKAVAATAPTDPIHRLLGKWRVTTGGYAGVWTIADKGRVVNNTGDTGSYKAAATGIEIQWSNGRLETVTYPEDGAAATAGVGGSGAPLALNRIP
jgi:hypothetical protein